MVEKIEIETARPQRNKEKTTGGSREHVKEVAQSSLIRGAHFWLSAVLEDEWTAEVNLLAMHGALGASLLGYLFDDVHVLSLVADPLRRVD